MTELQRHAQRWQRCPELRSHAQATYPDEYATAARGTTVIIPYLDGSSLKLSKGENDVEIELSLTQPEIEL